MSTLSEVVLITTGNDHPRIVAVGESAAAARAFMEAAFAERSDGSFVMGCIDWSQQVPFVTEANAAEVAELVLEGSQ